MFSGMKSESFNIYISQWIFTEAKYIPTNGKDLSRDKKHQLENYTTSF